MEAGLIQFQGCLARSRTLSLGGPDALRLSSLPPVSSWYGRRRGQSSINTGTTIVTFLMVFLIQSSQNRDSAAIQIKLDELIRVSKVKNMFVGIEHLTDEEIEELRDKCEARARKGHAVAHPPGHRAPGS